MNSNTSLRISLQNTLLVLGSLLFLGLGSLGHAAAVLSHSGEEVEYEYSVAYRSTHSADLFGSIHAKPLADFHAAHLFGLFHSSTYIERVNWPKELVEGFAGTMDPTVTAVESFVKPGDPYLWIKYSAKGRMVVHKDVLNQWLGGESHGFVELPLLVDFTGIYQDGLVDTDKLSGYRNSKWSQCTDEYYKLPGDFSYFYTPYDCTELGSQPLAQDVRFDLKRAAPLDTGNSAVVPTEEIAGDNGNGGLTTLYFVFGYDEDPKGEWHIRRDSGWKLYKALEKELVRKRKFTKVKSLGHYRELMGEDLAAITLQTPVKLQHFHNRTFFDTYILAQNGRKIVVRAGLFSTVNKVESRPLESFPRFWKEAWENGDYIHFGGHSGDGESLSIRNMLDNLEASDIAAIDFKLDKNQIAFIDACSSYAHYLNQYRALKPHGLHMMTYGLVSLFHLAEVTIQSMLEILLDSTTPMSWAAALEQIESAQLEPHMTFLHSEKTAAARLKKYRARGLAPSYLLNVSVD